MYIELVRKTLEFYEKNKKQPTPDQIGVENHHPDVSTKNTVFVTLYLDGEVIASSGRVHAISENTITELIGSTIGTLSDPRISGIELANVLQKLRIRVDILTPNDRRIINSYQDMLVRDEGLIVLSQNHAKLGVLLPKILPPDLNASQAFEIVMKKAGFPVNQDPSDYVLYAMRTKQEADF